MRSINADENAPTVEPCKDCEDRKQAEYIRHSSSWHELQALRKFKEEHERPQGEWEKPFKHNGKTYHKCNHCHVSSQLILIDNFCPNCGADMRKSQINHKCITFSRNKTTCDICGADMRGDGE